jgi:hypothetical protein
MSQSETTEDADQLKSRIVALVFLLPVMFLLLIIVGFALVAAIFIDILQLLWSGSEGAVRWVLGFVAMVFGNIRWAVTGEGAWHWWPQSKPEFDVIDR